MKKFREGIPSVGGKSPKGEWKDLGEGKEQGRRVPIKKSSIPEATYRELNKTKELGRKTGLSSLKKSGTKEELLESGSHRFKDGGYKEGGSMKHDAKYKALMKLRGEMADSGHKGRGDKIYKSRMDKK